MRKLIPLLFLIVSVSAFGQVFMPTPTTTGPHNNNVGINETTPQARLHISENDDQTNCQPALLIDGSAGSAAPGGPINNDGPEDEGSQTTCSTPYAIRVYQNNGANRNLAYDLAVNGVLNLGLGIDNISTNTTLNAFNHLGAYGATNNFVKLNATSGNAPMLNWNSISAESNLQNLEFTSGTNINNLITAMRLSPAGKATIGDIAINPNFSLLVEDGLLVNEGRVGIGTQTPETALHVKDNTPSSEINLEGSPSGKINGLLIENQGWRNHDFALEIRTGQEPEGATMTNGRVFSVSNAGTVHIGPQLNWTIPNGDFKLWVEGGIRTERVRVDIASENNWADYVFDEDYVLMPIEELEAFIKEHKHLPGVPSAEEVVKNGIDLAEMNKILLEKIEELTLRVIELEKSSSK
jgi:hypothetical protein